MHPTAAPVLCRGGVVVAIPSSLTGHKFINHHTAGAVAALLLAATGAHAAGCPVPAGGTADWIDPETTQCTIQKCTDSDLSKCLSASAKTTTMQVRHP